MSEKTQRQINPFFQVSQEEVSTTTGPVRLPIFYYQASALQCYYRIPVALAEPLFVDSPWKPAVFGRDRVLAGMAWYQYRDTDIGSYNEVALAVGVYPWKAKEPSLPWLDFLKPSFGRSLGFHILHLPVTSSPAYIAGTELWGYPKFITDIDFAVEQDLFVGEVKDPDGEETILRLTGDVFGGFPFPGQDLVLYSAKEGQQLRTVVNVKTVFHNLRGASFHLLPGYSSHPMCTHIKALGLHERHPFLVQFSRSFQSRLNTGQPV